VLAAAMRRPGLDPRRPAAAIDAASAGAANATGLSVCLSFLICFIYPET